MDGKLSWPLLRLIMAFWHNSTLFATQINLNFVHLDFGAPVIKLFSWRKITKFVLQLDRAPCSGSLSRLTKKLFNIQQQRKQRWQLYPCECEWRVSYCKHERMPSLHRFETDRLWDFFLIKRYSFALLDYVLSYFQGLIILTSGLGPLAVILRLGPRGGIMWTSSKANAIFAFITVTFVCELDSGCGSVGRAVTSDSRGPLLKPSHRRNSIMNK